MAAISDGPSGEFISVSGFGGETRGYAAYFSITKMSFRYPEVFREIFSRGNYRFRYPMDTIHIQKIFN
jgi:hypothetical protein